MWCLTSSGSGGLRKGSDVISFPIVRTVWCTSRRNNSSLPESKNCFNAKLRARMKSPFLNIVFMSELAIISGL